MRARHVAAAAETLRANEALQRYKEEQRRLDADADAAIAGGPAQQLGNEVSDCLPSSRLVASRMLA